jgi:hypothetical protein
MGRGRFCEDLYKRMVWKTKKGAKVAIFQGKKGVKFAIFRP